MQAVVHREYGVPRIEEVATPSPAPAELRVRVRAVSINPMDWYFVTGRPPLGRVASGQRRPSQPGRAGTDFAGTVDAVGSGVTAFADFARAGERHDLILDIAGGRSPADCRRVLHREGICVVIGGPRTIAGWDRWNTSAA